MTSPEMVQKKEGETRWQSRLSSFRMWRKPLFDVTGIEKCYVAGTTIEFDATVVREESVQNAEFFVENYYESVVPGVEGRVSTRGLTTDEVDIGVENRERIATFSIADQLTILRVSETYQVKLDLRADLPPSLQRSAPMQRWEIRNSYTIRCHVRGDDGKDRQRVWHIQVYPKINRSILQRSLFNKAVGPYASSVSFANDQCVMTFTSPHSAYEAGTGVLCHLSVCNNSRRDIKGATFHVIETWSALSRKQAGGRIVECSDQVQLFSQSEKSLLVEKNGGILERDLVVRLPVRLNNHWIQSVTTSFMSIQYSVRAELPVPFSPNPAVEIPIEVTADGWKFMKGQAPMVDDDDDLLSVMSAQEGGCEQMAELDRVPL